MEGMTDILIFQNNRAKHLFAVYQDVEDSKEDPTVKSAVAELKEHQDFFFPFFDLSKSFEIVIRDENSKDKRLTFEGLR